MKVSFTRSRTIEFSLGCEKNFLITMKALVFVVLKHLLQRRGEFYLHLGPVPEFLPVNSATRRFSMAVGLERQIFIKISLFPDAFIDHIRSLSEMISYHFTGLNCPMK